MRKYLTNAAKNEDYPAERKKRKRPRCRLISFLYLTQRVIIDECGCRHLRHLFCQVNHSIVVVYVWFLRTTNEASLLVTLVGLSVEFSLYSQRTPSRRNQPKRNRQIPVINLRLNAHTPTPHCQCGGFRCFTSYRFP